MNKAVFILVFLILAVPSGLLGLTADADARRGADFFQSKGCVNCHGKGATAGKEPDLGRRLDRDYTPGGIAARYFEKPGEAQRGKRFLEDKRCTECHSIWGEGGNVGPPVEKWESLASPVVLIQHMWNHQTQMHDAMAARRIPWPLVSSQELTDMLVYLQNLPQTRGTERSLLLPPPAEGETIFRDKGRAECHKGALALENRLGDSTLTDVAAMWNHAGPQFTQSEMGNLIAYLNSR